MCNDTAAGGGRRDEATNIPAEPGRDQPPPGATTTAAGAGLPAGGTKAALPEHRGAGRGGWQVARWANPDRRGEGCPRAGRTATGEDHGLLSVLCRTADRVGAYLDGQVLDREALTWTQLRVLRLINAQDGVGPAGICAGTGIDAHHVARVVGGLVDAGLARAGRPGRPPADRVVHATPAGALLADYLQTRVDLAQAHLIGTGGPGCLLRRIAGRLPLPATSCPRPEPATSCPRPEPAASCPRPEPAATAEMKGQGR